MKKYIFIFFLSLILFFNTRAYAKFPVHLGGFTLGDDLENYSQLIDIGPCQTIIATPYLGEVQMALRPEFKSGQIAYGLCDRPNKILRIKLKFEDSSKKFFKKLLARYEKNLGSPSEYKGDSFQTMIAWKWSFENEKKETISLILQHNIMDEDEKIGTAVKLTLTSQIEKERACFMDRHPEKKKKGSLPKISRESMQNLFIPF